MTVLDASAVLAWLQREPGWQIVDPELGDGAAISAANWSEVIQKAIQFGRDPARVSNQLVALMDVYDVTQVDAEQAARLWSLSQNLSLGDRLCLALAERIDTVAMTTERAWHGLPRARLIR